MHTFVAEEVDSIECKLCDEVAVDVPECDAVYVADSVIEVWAAVHAEEIDIIDCKVCDEVAIEAPECDAPYVGI